MTEPQYIALDSIIQFMEQGVPYNRVLGIKVEELKRGYARCRIPFRDELIGDPLRPAIHGGVISAFADTICGAAVFTQLRPGDRCSTVDLRIDYLRPGLNQDLRCEATVLRLGNQVAVTSGRVYQDGGDDIASAKAVFMIRRASDKDEDSGA